MIHKNFISNSAAWDYILNKMKAVNESSTEGKTIIWNQGLNEEALSEILKTEAIRKIFEDEENPIARQFVILMGGPSTGKGYLVNTKFGEGFGLINGKMMKDWLDIDTISKNDVHEGDAILREIQRGIAIICFNRLYNASLGAGKNGFQEAIKEMFYTTKDGNVNKLSSHLTYHDFMSYVAQAHDLGGQASTIAHDIRINKGEMRKLNSEINVEEEKRVPDKDKIKDLKKQVDELRNTTKNQRIELKKIVGDIFLESMKDEEVLGYGDFINEKEYPIKRLKSILNQSRSAEAKSEDAFDEFYDATMPDFWNSMRGWKKDGAHGIERFKDAARKEFEKDIKEKPDTIKSLLGGNIIVVDSPGEDVAKQPYVGECEAAEKAGFVTNIINLDPKLGGSMISLMRLSNFTRNVDEGDRMVDDSDITGYASNVEEAIHDIHEHKFPRGPVHRYFHLVKDIDEKDQLIKIVGALYGAKQNKDQFLYPKQLSGENSKTPKADCSLRELTAAIDKAGISITLAQSLKKLPMLSDWWSHNVRKVIFGINPVVLYEIKEGETSSFNTAMSSSDILAQVNDRLSKADDEFDDVIHNDYKVMLNSVDKWTKEYDEWTDKDTWNALSSKIINVKESNKVYGFDEYIKKLND
jgi:hypothetical protein